MIGHTRTLIINLKEKGGENRPRRKMKKTLLTVLGLGTALLVGCGQTLPVKSSDQIATSEPVEQEAQSYKQTEPLGIPIEIHKTSVKPFLALLGNPAREAKVAEDHVVVMFITNRAFVGKQDDKQLLIVMPEDDSRVAKLDKRALYLDLKKVEDDWVVDGLSLRPLEAEKLEAAKKVENKK